MLAKISLKNIILQKSDNDNTGRKSEKAKVADDVEKLLSVRVFLEASAAAMIIIFFNRYCVQ